MPHPFTLLLHGAGSSSSCGSSSPVISNEREKSLFAFSRRQPAERPSSTGGTCPDSAGTLFTSDDGTAQSTHHGQPPDRGRGFLSPSFAFLASRSSVRTPVESTRLPKPETALRDALFASRTILRDRTNARSLRSGGRYGVRNLSSRRRNRCPSPHYSTITQK